MVHFSDLRLIDPLLRAVAHEGYTQPTAIQELAIPIVLAGHDLMGCAQTGTGKTAAFALPILQRLAAEQPITGPRKARVLVLCPTRELATQIGDSFRVYGRNLHLRHTVIFGGVGQYPQVDALRRGVDVIVATPGRLLDLINQGHVNLTCIQVLVLDEADRMLDMGFIHDIRKVVAKVPAKRQTLMFSATMPPEIRQLAHSLLTKPEQVQVAPPSTTADGIDQTVYFVETRNKSALLAHLVRQLPMKRAIVFTRTKRGADRVARHLNEAGIQADSIHGNKAQGQRERALESFRTARMPVLVATDIASRGIDVDGITHVVNYDLSEVPEAYVHRIGRTARAGASGSAVSFCDSTEIESLRAIERLTRRKITVRTDAPQCLPTPPAPTKRPPRVVPGARNDNQPRRPAAPHARPPHHAPTSHAAPGGHRNAPSHHAAPARHTPSVTEHHPRTATGASPSPTRHAGGSHEHAARPAHPAPTAHRAHPAPAHPHARRRMQGPGGR